MPLTVLESFPEPRPTTNPYIVMLREALEGTPGVRVLTFSWRTALTADYDVFHVHWPDILASGHTPLKKLARQVLLVLLLLRLWLSRTPVVRTLHNLGRPDGASRREIVLLSLLDSITTLWVVINPLSPLDASRSSVQILHGHYRDWFSRFPREAATPGRLCYFGLVRPYKNVDGLIRAFRGIGAEEATRLADGSGRLSLTVAGKPESDELTAAVTELASGSSDIALDLRYIDEDEIVSRVTASELVVLPYREMHNSGSVLAALSLGRPVLVPANAANERLAAEVGAGWVRTYQGDLTSADLVAVLSSLRERPLAGSPDLSAREWSDAGEQHRAAFERALDLRRGR